jgi:biotin transport system substrate-specific component
MSITLHWNEKKLNFYRWRAGLGIAEKIIFSAIFAAAVAVSAQVRIPLPWTPVPITAQTITVFAGAVILGRYWGGIGFLLYIIMGMAGLPVFAGFKSGAAALIGPTGGYLAGFAISAFLIGYLTDKYVITRKPLNLLIIMLISNFAFVHLIGMIQLYLWMDIAAGNHFSLKEIFLAGSFPFIAGDIVKIIISAFTASALSVEKEFK